MLLRITVKPGSKIDSLSIDAEGNIRVKIKAPPVDGKANKYLIEFLAYYFEVSKSFIQLVKGETSQHKTIQLNISEEVVKSKLNGQ